MATYNTDAIKDTRLKIDMSETIATLQPSAAPFTAIIKRLKKQAAGSTTINWLDRENEARSDKASAAVADGVATTISVYNANYFRKGMILKVPSTNEQMEVTAVNASDITVVRGDGAAAIAKDAEILILGNSNAEGAGAPDDAGGEAVKQFNYTHILRTPFSVTNSANVSKVYGGKLITQEQKDKGVLHRIDMERILLFSERTEKVVGDEVKRTTRGLIPFLTENVLNVAGDGTLTEDAFNDWLAKVFTYGSNKKVLFASPTLLAIIAGWGRDKLQTVSGAQEKYGLSVVEYISPFGTLQITSEPLFVNGYAGYGMVLDMANVSYRPLRDTALKTNIQGADVDGRRDEYLTEFSLEVRLPKTHGLITNALKRG